MIKSAIHYLCLTGLFLCLLTFPIQAQDQELLANPGFEDPFTTDDAGREVANGWERWHIPRPPGSPLFVNEEPAYTPVAPNAARIRSGGNAQLVRSFFATHVAGVYQTVSDITPGTTLRFGVYAWVWSTTFDEVDNSEEEGDVLVSVGIDPTGGTNAESLSIIWSEPDEQYDSYNEYAVEAVADASTITVFVRTSVGVPVKHSNIYLDDASLVVIGDAPQPADPTATSAIEPTATESSAPLPDPDETAEPTPPIEATDEVIPVEPTEEPTAVVTEEGATTEPIEEPTEEPTLEPTVDVQPQPPTDEPPATSTDTPTELPTMAPPTATAIEPSQTPIIIEDVPTATETLIPPPTSTTIPRAATATLTPTLVPTLPPEPTLVPATSLPLPSATAIMPVIEGDFTAVVRYTVQRGDTVARLAERYGSSIQAIRDANGLDSRYLIFVGQELIIPVRSLVLPTATSIAAQPTIVPPAGSTTIYVVLPGDSLFRIARLFNTTVGTLAQLNGIVNVGLLQVGQQLRVPTSPTMPVTPPPAQQRIYVVQPGDTLYRLSLLFGVPIQRIAETNGIRQPNLIYVGQRLVIP